MKKVTQKYLVHLIMLCTLMSVNVAAWAEVKAFLNQDTFYEGDPITLTIETNNNSQEKPDLSVLDKNFDVLGTSSSTQINILNGHKRIKKSWTIELQPRNKGEIKIPSIMLGHEKTRPLTLKIVDIPAELEKQTSEHVFIESSVDIADAHPYVQQQIPYTVRLYYDASMQTGKIYSPTVENAVVEQLGEDRRYRTVRKGKKYSVVEKHFVISPEKSGKLHIPPTSVKGRLAIADKRRQGQNNRRAGETDFMNRFFNNSPFSNDPFFRDFGGGFFSNRSVPSKPFTSKSEPIDVDVQPIPKEFNGQYWLPAEDLVIKDSWSSQPPELRVGEPVTRTLVLQAKGLAGSQIPEVKIPKPENVRLYPEKSKSETRTDGKTVYGIKEMNISYIPDAQGTVTIPEINIDWWDVINKKQKKFTLPKWTLQVAPAAAGTSTEKPLTAMPKTENKNPPAQPQNADADKETVGNSSHSGWLLATLAILLLLPGYFIFKRYYRAKSHPGHTQPATINTDKIAAALQQACQKNDKQQAAKLLLALSKASWKGPNPPQNLAALASEIQQGHDEILALERALYADHNKQWNGAALCKAVKNGIKQKPLKKEIMENTLKPLYPV